MKKFLIVVMLLTSILLYGCNRNKIKDDTNVLTIKEAEMIGEALIKHFGEETVNKYSRSFGSISGYITEFNGIYIFIKPSTGGIPEGDVLTIGDYTFRESPSDCILVYYDKNIYSLSEAYNQKVIDDRMLGEIVERYTNEKVSKSLLYSIIYSVDKSIDSFFSNGYTNFIVIKEIKCPIITNNDGSKIVYEHIDYENIWEEDAYRWIDVKSEISLITDEDIELLKEYIPSLNK